MAVGDWYYWCWHRYPRRRWDEPSPCYGHRCKLLAVGGKGMVLVQFEFGNKVITDRQGLRKLPVI